MLWLGMHLLRQQGVKFSPKKVGNVETKASPSPPWVTPWYLNKKKSFWWNARVSANTWITQRCVHGGRCCCVSRWRMLGFLCPGSLPICVSNDSDCQRGGVVPSITICTQPHIQTNTHTQNINQTGSRPGRWTQQQAGFIHSVLKQTRCKHTGRVWASLTGSQGEHMQFSKTSMSSPGGVFLLTCSIRRKCYKLLQGLPVYPQHINLQTLQSVLSIRFSDLPLSHNTVQNF